MSNAQKSGNQEFDPTLGGSDPSATAATATPSARVNPEIPMASSQRRAAQSRVVPHHVAEAEEAARAALPVYRDAPLGGAGLSEEAKLVKAELEKQPKFAFHVPLEPGERAGQSYRVCTINGYRCEVRKGVQVLLPEAMYKLLLDAYRIETQTLDENPFNLDRQPNEVRAALRA